MSTRWQFCPQQKGDRQGSPACPSLHSLLTAACAPRQVINVSVQSLGIMSFTQGYRNTLGYKQKLLLELLRIQTKGFIKPCLSRLKYKLISVVHPGWILREGELSADNSICMGRFFLRACLFQTGIRIILHGLPIPSKCIKCQIFYHLPVNCSQTRHKQKFSTGIILSDFI